MTNRPLASTPREEYGKMGSAHSVIPAICICVVEVVSALLPAATGMMEVVILHRIAQQQDQQRTYFTYFFLVQHLQDRIFTLSVSMKVSSLFQDLPA